ncbi:MAG: hypothetical protein Kapaf2KO_15310 [Candidatus Kapaibacteriales bacterium]
MNKDLSEETLDTTSIYLTYLFRNKWIILVTTTIIAIVSILYSLYVVEPQFKSYVNVVPPKTSDDGGIGSAISSAMKNFGVSSLLGGDSEGYSMMVLLSSRTVKDSLIKEFDLINHYEIESGEMYKARKQLEANLEVEYEKEGNYIVSIWDTDPKLAAEMANRYIEITNIHAADIYRQETEHNLKFMDERMMMIERVIVENSDSLATFSSENKIFEPEKQAESYAKAISEIKLEKETADIAYNLAKNKYGQDSPETITQLNLLEELSKKVDQIENQPGFAGNFTLNNATSKAMRYYQLYANVEAFTKLRAIMMPMHEKMRLDAVKKQQYFYVVDEAIVAEKKDRPKRALIVLGATLGGLTISILCVLLVAGYREIKSKTISYSSESKV